PSRARRAPEKSATARCLSPRWNKWCASARARPASKRCSASPLHPTENTAMKKFLVSLLLGLGALTLGPLALAQAPASVDAAASAPVAPAAAPVAMSTDAAPAAAPAPKLDSGDTAWMLTST